jgi:hypothetical protein
MVVVMVCTARRIEIDEYRNGYARASARLQVSCQCHAISTEINREASPGFCLFPLEEEVHP